MLQLFRLGGDVVRQKSQKKVKFGRVFYFIYNLKENGNFTLPAPPTKKTCKAFNMDGTEKETHSSKGKRNINSLSVQSFAED